MWFLVWLKFLAIAMVTFTAMIACAVALFFAGLWIERKFRLRVPGILISLWLFYVLYFSVLWTCQEMARPA